MATHRIVGKVYDQSTNDTVANAQVDAWDADFGPDDALGSATTDANGNFTLEFQFTGELLNRSLYSTMYTEFTMSIPPPPPSETLSAMMFELMVGAENLA